MRDLSVASTVTPKDVAAALFVGGLQLHKHSPLNGFLDGEPLPASLTTDALEEMAGAGWVSSLLPPQLHAHCLEAFDVLRGPARHLELTAGSAGGLVTAEFFCARGPSDRWVRFEPDRGGTWARLEFFLTTRSLVERSLRALDLTVGSLLPPFRGRWTSEQFGVLLGLIDVYRATCLRAILDRAPMPAVIVTSDAIFEALEQGLARPHYYWGASLGSLISPHLIDISKGDVDRVLEELSRLGCLTRSAAAGVYHCVHGVREFAVSLLLMPSFLVLSQTVYPDPVVAERLAVVRGANSMWLFDFLADGRNEAVIEPLASESVRQRLLETIDGSRVGRSDAGPPTEPFASPTETAVLSAGDTETLASETCFRCTLPLRPTARFCTRCGQIRQHVVPMVSCQRCGQVTRSGKYCTACGAALHQETAQRAVEER